MTFFKNTELSGFVDTYYSYNLNTPAKPCSTVGGVAIFNCLHNFDVAHNSFSLNLAELALEKKPTADSRGGFRIDLDYGSAGHCHWSRTGRDVPLSEHSAGVRQLPRPDGKGQLAVRLRQVRDTGR